MAAATNLVRANVADAHGVISGDPRKASQALVNEIAKDATARLRGRLHRKDRIEAKVP